MARKAAHQVQQSLRSITLAFWMQQASRNGESPGRAKPLRNFFSNGHPNGRLIFIYLGVLNFIMGKALKVAFPILLPLVHAAVQPQRYRT